MTADYLTEAARTNDFRLGVPRDPSVAPDGRVLFLRSAAGDDPVTSLWLLDGDTERLVADGHGGGGELSDAERSRRERARERASGIVGYATDSDFTRAVYMLDGALWTVQLSPGGPGGHAPSPERLPARGPVVGPWLDPTGRWVAYVSDGALRVIGADGTGDRALAVPESDDVTYGLAEHVAAESMHRHQGYWWSPDGERLLVSRVDSSRVTRWHLADPSEPGRPPSSRPYPVAGSANADVSLWLYPVGGGDPVRVDATDEYVAAVTWRSGDPLVVLQTREQRDVRVLSVDPATGATSLVHADHDDHWWELVAGVPDRLDSGELVWTVDDGDTRRLTVGGTPVTPLGLQVRSVSAVDGAGVVFRGGDDPTEVHVYRWSPDGLARLTDRPGVHDARLGGDTTVVTSRSMDHPGPRTTVRRAGTVRRIRSLAHVPAIEPHVRWHTFGERELRSAVLLPTGYRRGSGPLPVLLDPYGGPGGQVVVRSLDHFHLSQWFADAGYAVLITDGRGTPGRGPRWEKTVYRDKLTAALTDQVDALHAAAAEYPEFDLTRVAIRGWSYGGYLAAAAVLRRPDVFHAAVAGAPVTDPRLYDTHWQERFLGHPDAEPEVYDRNSLIPDAPNLVRPLLLIHGFADDNVYVAHTMRLSAALLSAGRPHTVLPLTASSHIAGETSVRANLPRLQLTFLNQSLGLAESGDR